MLYDWLLTTMHGTGGVRVALVLAAVVICLIVVEADVLLPRAPVAIVLCAGLLIALPAETGYAFKRLFAVNGTSGLPLTLDQSIVFGWVDRTITTTSEAMMVPYPVIRDDYWANVGFWWDFEFWNKSVDREAARPNQFSPHARHLPQARHPLRPAHRPLERRRRLVHRAGRRRRALPPEGALPRRRSAT